MPEIIPFKDLQDVTEISTSVIQQFSMYKDIEISERQIENVRIKDARIALNEKRVKYGI